LSGPPDLDILGIGAVAAISTLINQVEEEEENQLLEDEGNAETLEAYKDAA
jgi:hypothetical protein